MMIEDYCNGKQVEVWNSLRQMGSGVRDPGAFGDAYAVARETMGRVRNNVALIARRLEQAGYRFSDPDKVHVPPDGTEAAMIAEIETKIGPMPLSLRAFYEVVGSVNFCQSLDQLIQWQRPERVGATEVETLGEEDPLCIVPLALLHDDMTNPNKTKRERRYARFNWRREGPDRWYCFIASDEFHKANYSGGENYNVFIPDACADFRIHDLFLGEFSTAEEDREWFVDYLRNSFRGGGFRGKYDPEEEISRKRLPQSPLIGNLSQGLLEV